MGVVAKMLGLTVLILVLKFESLESQVVFFCFVAASFSTLLSSIVWVAVKHGEMQTESKCERGRVYCCFAFPP